MKSKGYWQWMGTAYFWLGVGGLDAVLFPASHRSWEIAGKAIACGLGASMWLIAELRRRYVFLKRTKFPEQ